MIKILITAIFTAYGGGAFACSAVEDNDARLACYDARYSEVSLIRCTSGSRITTCELMTPSPDNFLSCVVFDDGGEPIAREIATGSSGLMLRGIDAGAIAHVDCEITR